MQACLKMRSVLVPRFCYQWAACPFYCGLVSDIVSMPSPLPSPTTHASIPPGHWIQCSLYWLSHQITPHIKATFPSFGSDFLRSSVTFWPYPYFFSHLPVCLHTLLQDPQYLGLHYHYLQLPQYCSCSPLWYPSSPCPWAFWACFFATLLAV